MKVFLTGGTGFIGQSLNAELLRRGWDVVALARHPESPRGRELAALGADCVRGDVTDRDSIRAGMGGADLVIHAAGHYEFGVDRAGRERMVRTNVDGTDNVLGVALELGVPRVVYVSSVIAFGDSDGQQRDEMFERRTPCSTTYEATKTRAHEIALGYRQRGLPLVVVCPNAVIGPSDHSAWGYFLRLFLNLLIPFGWSADRVNGLVYVDDVAVGIALAGERGRIGETYILAGEAKTRRQHVEFWSVRSGRPRIRIWLPARPVAALFATLEAAQRLAGLPAFMSRETVRVCELDLDYSSAKAERELGWTCRSAEAMWFDTIDRELEQLAARRKGLIARLKPAEA